MTLAPSPVLTPNHFGLLLLPQAANALMRGPRVGAIDDERLTHHAG
jgi:hypothetical protein